MKLYLFTNELSLRVLREGKLPLVAMHDLQDPFLDPAINTHMPEQAPISETEFQNELKRQYQSLSEDIRSIVSFDYFVQEAVGRRQEIEAAMQGRRRAVPQYVDVVMQQKLAVGSLYEHIQSPELWWAQGGQHRGMAFELDVDAAQLRATTYESHPQYFAAVGYSAERPMDTHEVATSSAFTQRFRPLFRKSSVFSQEGEWRLVRLMTAASKTSQDALGRSLGLFHFPHSALTGIVFGCFTPPEEIEHIVSAIHLDMRYRHVKLWCLEKDPVRFLFHRVAWDS
ncbi:hypothetical protein BTA51_01295 [Hahella sp. CCB-MM4]|uniref:DUF2971 domain-containing protein n=1 Tax=Hahella sp. (strain CCB-MM4) TaxID=1926491 RepID=UPI000B9B7CC3|nr:DUF2971 domain-containing protein [Hahella sp. CCB-MM4]OZG75062.1 hypothetical protein BTA51_01295 [Hahella sp. CCB-MM4]